VGVIIEMAIVRFDTTRSKGEPGAALLEAQDVTFGYGEPVLRGVSFELSTGQILAILGPNGSGKTTLLKISAGILKAHSGRVTVLGRDVGSMSRRDLALKVGYVAQESSIQFPLTAMEFVLQGRFAQGRLLGFESEQDVAEAKRAMELTETSEFASRLVGELSGGERQRVMLARALASRPRLLVLDEPVANLDISHQVKMMSLIKRLAAGQGMSAIVVTHELNLAAEFATRVLMLKSGAVLACGRPADVMTEASLRELFDTRLLVDVNPATGAPRITLTDLC
jgi:iron complex transport system ATP-binding protein